MEDILDEMERRFDVKIKTEDGAIKERTVSGIFEAKSLDHLLRVLCMLTEKKYVIKGKEVIIF